MTHAAAIKTPLLVLQGDADNVVPPAQAQLSSTRCAPAAGRSSTTCTRARATAGRKPETMTDELERVEAFLTRWVLHR